MSHKDTFESNPKSILFKKLFKEIKKKKREKRERITKKR